MQSVTVQSITADMAAMPVPVGALLGYLTVAAGVNISQIFATIVTVAKTINW